MRNLLTLAVLCLAVVGAGTAYASGNTPHILGHGGPKIALDVMCKRAVVAPPGETVAADVNVLGQQIHCLIRRPDPFAVCVKRLGPAPDVVGKFDHGTGKPGDWSGVDKLQAYVVAMSDCADARLVNMRTRRP